jgi:hypothetical protein
MSGTNDGDLLNLPYPGQLSLNSKQHEAHGGGIPFALPFVPSTWLNTSLRLIFGTRQTYYHTPN